MDLVAGIRKEGSRGGRDSFKWSDVKESSHRENYLGHSIMAPVGRWQQNRDLNWYAKSGDSADKAKQQREEEIRRIKEAEQDAMAVALGLPVAPRASNNANLTPLGGGEVRKAVQEATEGDGEDDGGRGGIGFGSFGGVAGNDAEDEILAPIDRGTMTGDEITGSIAIVTIANIVNIVKPANTGTTGLGLARCRDLRDRNVAIEDQRRIVVVTLVVWSAIGRVLHDVIAIVVIMKAVGMRTIDIIVDRRWLVIVYIRAMHGNGVSVFCCYELELER
ncbi:uncharacterized protein BHQ10_001031 [Talaromyces amestolkiae]|uniref:Multiple myeloma tumor-associated protein 2-like N-terminal domain-containing protein n=1 Tax=Talaromyces amestolkiae TaxID=1196081 RepID=A0A364KN97_TALAM|nr:uncharacterized protein BHQ10_001031 [Talaromyces amestolkiae]RAO65019.1 hypothetical protein BHQ10_001031 [Talaromyces amestolkiae]